jgi:hypothetical protein
MDKLEHVRFHASEAVATPSQIDDIGQVELSATLRIQYIEMTCRQLPSAFVPGIRNLIITATASERLSHHDQDYAS